MARRLKFDIPGPDWRVDPERLRAESIASLFEVESSPRLCVEIGYGGGEFLLEQARRDPGGVYLGLEISHKRSLKMARRLARTELSNIRLLEVPAEYVVCELLPPAVVCTFWVNYPDPWPKRRHQRRRLLQPDFVRDLCARLLPSGSIEVATDHAAYAEAIAAVLSAEPGLENAFPAPFLREVPGRPPTRYERKWLAEERPLHFFRYRRSGPPCA